MANLESRLKNAPYFCCERRDDPVFGCQLCETCVLARKIFFTKEWFQRTGEISQRRFLVSILEQLDSLYLLHYFQTILQATQGKDFVYNRSRINLSKKEGKIMKSSLNQILDKTVEQKMREILCWFGTTTHQTKANYTLLLLQMCDPKLLLTAATVIRVLLQRKQNNISGLDQDSSHMFFFPEKDHRPQFDTLRVNCATRTKNTSFPLSKDLGKESLLKKKAPKTGGQCKGSLQWISEMNRLFPKKADMRKTGHAPSDLLVDLDTVRDLCSGSSKCLDFIRHLPIHLSKYILSMLDKNSLNRCSSVSQHWATLVQQVKMDLSMHMFLQNQITLLQGSYTRGIDPNYASKLSIPVPKMTEDGKRMRVKNQKWKLRTKNDYNLWTAYQNQETQQVQAEERNVFCGTYNIRILSDTWDRNRIIHYSGGNLVAVSSNRKIQLLDILQVKEVPIVFRGHAGSVRALFLCEQQNFLLSGSYDLSIRYWDLKSGTCVRIFNGHQGTITCMDLYNNRLVSGARDCQVKASKLVGICYSSKRKLTNCVQESRGHPEWDIETGKCLKTFKHKDPILATRINDTYIVSSCERGIVKVWHIAMAQLVKAALEQSNYRLHRYGPKVLKWRAPPKLGHCVLVESQSPEHSTQILAWTLSGHEGAVKCLCFDEWHLLSGSADGLVMAWSMVGKYERCLMAFKHPNYSKSIDIWKTWSALLFIRPLLLLIGFGAVHMEVLHVAFLFLRVISACADGKIRIYNFLNGNCLKVMKANSRGDPVLSFFIQGNRMLINTESNVLMFQFENIKWHYSQERAKQRKNKDREEDREENSFTEVLSKASTHGYSLKGSPSSKQVVAQESLLSKPHRSRILLRAARLPSATSTEALHDQGKPTSPRRDKKRESPVSKEANGLDGGQESLEAKSLSGDRMNDDVEKVPKQEQLETPGDLTSHSKKKTWQISMLPDRFLLTINALQQAHNSGEFAYPSRPQTQIIDTWVPSISHPRKVLSFKGKSVQHAVDRLRTSHPPVDVKQTSIPLEIQKLQPNLKKSLHSPRVQSTIPQPMIIQAGLAGSLRGEDPASSSTDRTVRSTGPLTSRQVIKPNRMLPPPVSMRTQPVKKERPHFYTALNPFRVNTEFMLLTVREEKEYEEAKMKEYQVRKPTGVVNLEKARKAAWIRKIQGLPIDNFMKHGKTAAPELGVNVFI